MPLVKPEVAYAYLQRANGVKFVAAVAAADNGDSNAMAVSPSRDMERRGHEVQYVSYVNGSGATEAAAIAVRLRTSEWVAGQVTAAGVYTADTTDAQDAGTADFPMHDRTDSGSGFLVGANIPFNVIGWVQSAAGDQTTPVFLTEYWNGSAWTDIQASLLIGTATTDLRNGDSTGEKVHLWDIPNDWSVGGTPVATVPTTTYNMRFRTTHSGVGTADPAASQMYVGVARFMHSALPADTTEHDLSTPVRFPREGDALFGVYGNAAGADVYFNVQHRFYW
jgi:hypothetical protein